MKYFFIALILLVASSDSEGQATDSVNSKDEKLIKKVLTEFTDAWNKHDAKAFSNVFSEDADFTNVRGTGAHGRSEVEKFHAPLFTTRFKDTYQKITQIKIRRHRHGERLQTTAARQLDLALDMPRQAIPSGFLAVDVERQRHRRNNPETLRLAQRKKRRPELLLDVLVGAL